MGVETLRTDHVIVILYCDLNFIIKNNTHIIPRNPFKKYKRDISSIYVNLQQVMKIANFSREE